MPKNYSQSISKDVLAQYCLNNILIIPYVEITVSAQCTLHCKDCSNFMQYYEKPSPMNLKEVLAWICAFLDAVDCVRLFRVMGGEALMQKELPEVLKVLLQSTKVEYMELVSNATIMPKPEIISLLKSPKASIFFSNYGEAVCPKYKTIIDNCLAQGIVVSTRSYGWIDAGDTSIRTQNINEIKQIYKKCLLPCKHIWNGEFHVCPRSAHGKALGMIKMKEQDYVRLLDTSKEERRRQIRALYDVEYIDACACCDWPIGPRIKPAIQGETIKYKMVTE